ncbi:MAG: hypothetical protein IJD65_05530 [Mailhella sp.]|nr:hypothetical protein [Mailhella sp.]
MYTELCAKIAPIVPFIDESIQTSLRCHAAGEELDGRNHNSKFTFSCNCFGNLSGRLNWKFGRYRLENGDPFELDHEKGLAVLCRFQSEIVRVYISKVAADTRIPRGGRRVKQAAKDSSLFLSEEIEKMLTPSLSKEDGEDVFMLGYDADPEKGLGKICLSKVIFQGKKFVSQHIHEFRRTEVTPTYEAIQPEIISYPEVRLVGSDLAG